MLFPLGVVFFPLQFLISKRLFRPMLPGEIFIRLCGSGYLSFAKYFYHNTLTEKYDPSLHYKQALEEACVGGHLDVVQWIFEFRPYTTDEFQSNVNIANAISCDYGHVAILKWLFTTYHSQINFWAFCGACAHGHLDIVKWIASNKHYTKHDISTECYSAFRLACANGHLSIAKWLTAAFHITQEDARSRGEYVLYYACINGHLEMAKWLVKTFSFDKNDFLTFKKELVDRERLTVEVSEWIFTLL